MTLERLRMEDRRMLAAELFKQGHTQGDVARRLSVSRQSASRWHAQWKSGGSMKAKPAPGRPSKLTPEQQEFLKDFVRTHPTITGRALADGIQRSYGVKIDRDHALRLRNFWLGRTKALCGRVA